MGRPAVECEFEIIGEITSADIVKLETVKPRESTIGKLRERHHGLARIIASGIPDVTASEMTGYTLERIGMLKRDPTFVELVEFYSANKEANFRRDLRDRMEGVAVNAADELAERIENNPELIKTPTLIDIVKNFADRTGYGPQTTTNVNVNVGLAKRMEEAKRRMIDITPKKEEAA